MTGQKISFFKNQRINMFLCVSISYCSYSHGEDLGNKHYFHSGLVELLQPHYEHLYQLCIKNAVMWDVTMYFARLVPMLQANLLPSSSGWKSKREDKVSMALKCWYLATK